MLIDTGLGVANIRDVVDRLTRLPVLAVTTQVHWDHIGGHGYFEHIAVHESERDWLESGFPIPLEAVRKSLVCKPCDFPEEFMIDDYHIFQGKPQQILRDGEWLSMGNRKLYDEGKLEQGNGVFDFGEYQIHI